MDAHGALPFVLPLTLQPSRFTQRSSFAASSCAASPSFRQLHLIFKCSHCTGERSGGQKGRDVLVRRKQDSAWDLPAQSHDLLTSDSCLTSDCPMTCDCQWRLRKQTSYSHCCWESVIKNNNRVFLLWLHIHRTEQKSTTN